MTSQARALLDQLMGPDRNKPLSSQSKRTPHSWKSSDVCKYYLMDFCPHDLFVNSRADLGKCQLIHSDIFRDQFHSLAHDDRNHYQSEYLGDYLGKLRRVIDNCELRIRRTRDRVKALPPDMAISDESRRAISLLNQELSNTVKVAEQLAEQGKIEESSTEMVKVNEINLEIKKLAGDKYLQFLRLDEVVCDVCGAIMTAPKDLETCEDHLRGKQHSGFTKIRNKITELEKMKESMRNIRRRDRSRSADRKRRRSRSRSRSRDRSRNNSYRNDQQSRDRDRQGHNYNHRPINQTTVNAHPHQSIMNREAPKAYEDLYPENTTVHADQQDRIRSPSISSISSYGGK